MSAHPLQPTLLVGGLTDAAAFHSSHCAAKVHHLRQSAGLGQVAGKLKKYSKKDVTDANASDKYVHSFTTPAVHVG